MYNSTRVNENNEVKKIMKKLYALLMSLAISTVTAVNAFAAGNIADSVAVTGTKKLIDDVTTAALVIAPVIGVVLIVYFCIRRSAADEMDQKKWNNRIATAVVSIIGAVLATSLLNVVVSYYSS